MGLAPEAEHFADQARAPATRRAYTTDTRRFAQWCAERGETPAPCSPAVLGNYLSWMAASGLKVATIQRSLAAISAAHKKLGYESPRRHELVREVMKGIRRQLGVAPTKKRPILVDDLRSLVAATGESLKGTRDRALLTLGFAGAFRRAELVSLEIGDLLFTQGGLEVTIRHSKTDQEGEGTRIGVPYGSYPQTCPVRSVKAWLEATNLLEGPLFRPVNRHAQISDERLSGRAVALTIKTLARAAGLDPTSLAGHSLRAGLASAAIKAERVVMMQTRHRSVAVFRGYVRLSKDLFFENAAAGIGL